VAYEASHRLLLCCLEVCLVTFLEILASFTCKSGVGS